MIENEPPGLADGSSLIILKRSQIFEAHQLLSR